MRVMNALVRFLCLIFGISVDGDASQREQWAKRRRDMGIEQPDDELAEGQERTEPERAAARPAHAERK